MESITLNYNGSNDLARRTIEYILSLGVFEIRSKSNKLTYDEISNLKAEHDRLITEGKTQKSKMIVGFTPEERKMFDNGIPINTVFEHLTEQHTAKC